MAGECPGSPAWGGVGWRQVGAPEQSPLFRRWGKPLCHPPHRPKDPITQRRQQPPAAAKGSAEPTPVPIPVPC